MQLQISLGLRVRPETYFLLRRILMQVMTWDKLLNKSRLKDYPPREEHGRSPFHADHDKIIFSGAFRRLAKKTQVHPLAINDHVHNRLTHSLEVSCVGRSLATRVGLELEKKGLLPTGITATDIGDIVEATCIAHDIGNPPFGHSGEEAIREWFSSEGKKFIQDLPPEFQYDLTTFEGNAQGLRVLTKAEGFQYEYGMRLTYATLGAFIKYPYYSVDSINKCPYTKYKKYGAFQSEKEIFDDIQKNNGLIKVDGMCVRHPLVYLMEAADDFCYGIIDLEDGIAMGILSWEEVFEIIKNAFSESEIKEIEEDTSGKSDGRKISLTRGRLIQKFIDAGAEAFIKHEEEFMNGEIFKQKKNLISLCPENIKDTVKKSKDLAEDKIFKNPRKIEIEIGAYNCLAVLLNALISTVEDFIEQKSFENIGSKSKRILDLVGRETFPPSLKLFFETTLIKENDEYEKIKHNAKYESIMRMLDFISGMTDHYATYLSQKFSGNNQR